MKYFTVTFWVCGSGIVTSCDTVSTNYVVNMGITKSIP